MTGICGLLLDGNHSVVSAKLKEISSGIAHRGRAHSHIFSAEHLLESKSPSENPKNESKLIGLSILERGDYSPHFDTHDKRIMILDSNLPHKVSPEMLKGFATDFSRSISGGGTSLLRFLFGTVAFYLNEKGLWLFRSVDGTKPIFYSKERGILAFATERKGLWKAGFKQCDRVQPGFALRVDWTGNILVSRVTHRYRELNLQRCFKSEIVSQLKMTLTKSFERLSSQECAVLFSGGIDSSLAALLADRIADQVILVTAKAERSNDARAAAKAADILGMNHFEVEVDEETVWNVLPRIIYSIETTDKMDVEIAIPIFLSALEATKRGYQIIVSGQGPDELFGGYYRYLEMYDPENPAKLIEEIKSDISTTYRRNIERDEMAIANSGGRAFFPYLSTDFVELALAAPISYKISPDDEPSRKRLLRELALSMGLPLELGSVPKKATQYSSGSSNILVDSVRNNVPNLSDFGRNRAGRRVQEVLDAIGFKLGIPSTREEQSSLEIDMAATDTFLKDLESEISID